MRTKDRGPDNPKTDHRYLPTYLHIKLYRVTFFWWESDSVSKAWKFIWVSLICFTSILIFFPVFHVFKLRFWFAKTLRNMNLKLKGFWKALYDFFDLLWRFIKELFTSFLHNSCFETFLKNSQKTPLQEPRFKIGSFIDLLQ